MNAKNPYLGNWPTEPDEKKMMVISPQDAVLLEHGEKERMPVEVYISSDCLTMAKSWIIPGRRSEPWSHEGELLLHVTKGALYVQIMEGGEYEIKEQEQFFIPANIEYRLWNNQDTLVEFVFCVAPKL